MQEGPLVWHRIKRLEEDENRGGAGASGSCVYSYHFSFSSVSWNRKRGLPPPPSHLYKEEERPGSGDPKLHHEPGSQWVMGPPFHFLLYTQGFAVFGKQCLL